MIDHETARSTRANMRRVIGRRKTQRSSIAAVSLAATVFVVPSAALADGSNLGGFALDQLDPAPAGDDFFAVPSPHTPSGPAPLSGLRAYLMFDYAHEPLRLQAGSDVVSDQGFLRVDLSMSLLDRLQLSFDAPVAVVQSGDAPSIKGVVLTSPDSVESGDDRFGARVRLWGEDRTPLQIGVGANVYFPTAGENSYAGDGALRVEPQLLLGGRVDMKSFGFVWDAFGGVMVRASDNPHSVVYGAGVAAAFAHDLFQIGPEVFASTEIGDSSPLTSRRITVQAPSGTGVELLGEAKLRLFDGLVIGFGAGPGFTQAIGTPSYRIVGMVGWAPLAKPKPSADADSDADGVLDSSDACPNEPGDRSEDPKKNGCPPGDRDGDKIPDSLDACPSLKGRANADPTRNGCPADYDRDGVPDTEDACPNQKGIASSDPKRNGCPGEADGDGDGIADRVDACPKQKGARNDDPAKNGCPTGDSDGDGIVDIDDACPNERGAANADKTKNGCPKEVRVTTAEIVILRQVQFRFGKASLDQTIDPVSDDLLTEVRDVILQHPEITQIEVQGHADDVGTAEFNQQLSEQRAAAVRAWLIAKGIEQKRLVSKGYGSTRPVAGNDTEDGRQKNRRVQLVILTSK